MDPINQTSKKSVGPLVGIAIIAVLLIVAAFYFWGGKIVSNSRSASQAAAVSQASTSDEIGAIEADLSATDPGPDLSSLNGL